MEYGVNSRIFGSGLVSVLCFAPFIAVVMNVSESITSTDYSLYSIGALIIYLISTITVILASAFFSYIVYDMWSMFLELLELDFSDDKLITKISK